MEQVISNVLMFFEFFTLFYVLICREFRKPERKRNVALGGCLLFLVGTMIAGYDLQMITIGPLSLYIIWIIVVHGLLFDVSLKETIACGIGQWLIISMLEISIHLESEPLQVEEYITDYIEMLIVICVVWLLYFFVIKRETVQVFRLSVKVWCLMDVIMFILTTMMTFFTIVLMRELPNNTTIIVGGVLSALGGPMICILLFVLLYFGNSAHDYRQQKELAEMQNRQQRDYFLQLLKREEETRIFRHDIINELLEMHNHCVNKNYDKVEEYLENTLGIVQEISKSSYDVGNDIVNTILNYYLKPLKEKCDIEISGYMSENLPISERDLCILSANLIKNASEAVSKSGRGKIWISIHEGKEYLHLQVKNTFEGNIEFDKKGIPVTSKEDKRNHGIGTYSILDIVKRNGGKCNIEAVEGVYKAEIYLKI